MTISRNYRLNHVSGCAVIVATVTCEELHITNFLSRFVASAAWAIISDDRPFRQLEVGNMIIIGMLIVNVLVINTIRATPVEEGELEISAFLPKQPALEAKKK